MSSMDEFNLQFYNVKKEKKSEKKTVCTAQKDKKDGKYKRENRRPRR